MAKKNNKRTNPNLFKKMAQRIQDNSDSLYQSVYYSDPKDKHILDQLKNNIDTSIKSIINNNSDSLGEPNISKMYERLLMNAQRDGDTADEFKKLFEDNEFMTSIATTYMQNRWVKAFDDEIDEILRYFPKLEEALQTIRDNVLSSDSFSKDYLSMKDELQTDESTVFNSNMNEMKKNYNLVKLTNEIYYDTAKYGEQFVYVVPYETAINTLLKNKSTHSFQNQPRYTMGVGVTESGSVYVEENGNYCTYDGNISDVKLDEFNFNVEVDKRGLITSIVEDAKTEYDKVKPVEDKSLCEQYLNEHGLYLNEALSLDGTTAKFDKLKDADMEITNKKLPTHYRFDETLPDDFEMPLDDTTADGLVNKNGKLATTTNKKINHMNGCIVKRLDREKVVPIYINDLCLGYYYFEYDDLENAFDSRHTTTVMNNTITGLQTNSSTVMTDIDNRRDELIKFLANRLANAIDADFVNKNQDLKKEIYYILKYNDQFCVDQQSTINNMRCTYIPPQDIHHFYFKLDEKIHRGISDLALSLVPAKLYVSIYITNALAVMTRGNDKRVYYVKQTVETNIAKTLLKTINEIKKSNFGMRQVENINNVLDIVGRFNDYIIPRGSDGSSPIDFEVMPGQQIEIKTELLNILEEAAINVTGIPIEIIQNRQSPDYALQLTMQNSKFLRFVYGRQSDFQDLLSRLFTRIYNIEYGNRDNIQVTLPPPLFINITNTNQLIVNVNDFCDTLTNIILADEQDETLKMIFAKDLKTYYLGSYLNMPVITNILNKASQKAKLKTIENPEE